MWRATLFSFLSASPSWRLQTRGSTVYNPQMTPCPRHLHQNHCLLPLTSASAPYLKTHRFRIPLRQRNRTALASYSRTYPPNLRRESRRPKSKPSKSSRSCTSRSTPPCSGHAPSASSRTREALRMMRVYIGSTVLECRGDWSGARRRSESC